MNIGIIGASEKAGSRILKEAVDRKHEVTAIDKRVGIGYIGKLSYSPDMMVSFK